MEGHLEGVFGVLGWPNGPYLGDMYHWSKSANGR